MVKIILNKPVNAKTMITGFKGFGYVGYLTITHLIDELNAELIGLIDTIYFPPYISIKDGVVYNPYLIYGYGENIILLFEDLGVEQETNYLIKKIVEWTKKINIRKYVLVGGLDKSIMKDGDEPVKIIMNRPWIKRYGRVDPILKEPIRVVGPLAIMLHYATIFDIPAIGVLSYAEAGSTDHRAAANAIIKLNSLLNLNISIDKLLASATLIEERVEKSAEKEERRGEGLYA